MLKYRIRSTDASVLYRATGQQGHVIARRKGEKRVRVGRKKGGWRVALLLGCDVCGFRWDIVILLQRVVSILGIHLVNQPRTAEAHINSHASPWVYL
jgi:hypothetical protein